MVTQTVPSIKSSTSFGVASTMEKWLRRGLAPALHFPKDRAMQNSFRSTLVQWRHEKLEKKTDGEQRMKGILSHSFNPETSVGERWKANFRFEQLAAHETVIHIPGFVPEVSLVAPAGTISVDCKFAAAAVRVHDGLPVGHASAGMTFQYDRSPVPAESKSLLFPTEEDCLVIIAASVTYRLEKHRREERLPFMPSSVIGAWYIEKRKDDV